MNINKTLMLNQYLYLLNEHSITILIKKLLIKEIEALNKREKQDMLINHTNILHLFQLA